MYMITPYGDEDGAYAVANDYGERTLYFFQDEEDAERFVGLLEADEEDLEMEVVEIDPELAIKACHQYNYKYAIITPDDFVIPPRKYDFVQND